MRAIIWAIFAATAATASLPKQVQKDAGYEMISAFYETREAKSLDDVPEPARTRVVTHLKERLGERFYSALHFSGGQIVDFAEFHRLEPNWKNYQWEVFAYRLNFQFRMPEKGIKYYTASINVRSDGSVIDEIDLPNVAEHPDRADFVSLSDAMQTATAAGFDVPHCRIKILYRPKYDRCIYTFRQLSRDQGGIRYYKGLEVDAHTARRLETYNEEARE